MRERERERERGGGGGGLEQTNRKGRESRRENSRTDEKERE